MPKRILLLLLFLACVSAARPQTALPANFALSYSSYFPAVGPMVRDASGNIYIAGAAYGPTPVVDPLHTIQSTPGDIYIAKLDPAAKQVVFSTFLGGKGDFVTAAAVDAAGNLSVTGIARSKTFPVTPGAFQTRKDPVDTIFVSKIDTVAAKLVYSTFLGSQSAVFSSRPNPFINTIVVDASGSTVIGGAAGGLVIPTTPGAVQTTTILGPGGPGGPGFITKLNRDGGALVFSTYFGGDTYTSVAALAIDAAGAVYATGTSALQSRRGMASQQPLAHFRPLALGVLSARSRLVETRCCTPRCLAAHKHLHYSAHFQAAVRLRSMCLEMPSLPAPQVRVTFLSRRARSKRSSKVALAVSALAVASVARQRPTLSPVS